MLRAPTALLVSFEIFIRTLPRKKLLSARTLLGPEALSSPRSCLSNAMERAPYAVAPLKAKSRLLESAHTDT
jgi:hypothetical protein